MSQSQYYVTHYFNAQNAGSFMAVSLIGLIVVLAIVLLTAKLQKHYKINIENPTEVELAQIDVYKRQVVLSVTFVNDAVAFGFHCGVALP